MADSIVQSIGAETGDRQITEHERERVVRAGFLRLRTGQQIHRFGERIGRQRPVAVMGKIEPAMVRRTPREAQFGGARGAHVVLRRLGRMHRNRLTPRYRDRHPFLPAV